MSHNSVMLEISGLTKIFKNQDDQQLVLENVNLELCERDFLCILGPSGCGKTTLLRCIAGFEEYSGSIRLNGELKNTTDTDRIMVFQDFNQLFPWKTVEANIQYPFIIKGIRNRKILKEISDNALAKVKLTGYEKYYPHQLSGGMKQRVAIAKALALKPKVILMDEPFAALDALTRRDLQNELLRIAEEEVCTFIFVTHNIQEAVILGKRIIVLKDKGRIQLDKKITMEKPISPASKGYGELWQELKDAIYI